MVNPTALQAASDVPSIARRTAAGTVLGFATNRTNLAAQRIHELCKSVQASAISTVAVRVALLNLIAYFALGHGNLFT